MNPWRYLILSLDDAMSPWRYIFASLAYHVRIHGAVALGVIAATAVLTGALLVGDSVRGSLRRLTIDGLGRIDHTLVAPHYFRAALADELAAQPGFADHFTAALPAIIQPRATLVRQGGDPTRTTGVFVVATGPEFWDASDAAVRPTRPPGDDEIVLNQPLAEALRARVGDTLVLRLERANMVPADSALGAKEGRVRSLAQLKVIDIVPAEGLGRFSLRTSQTAPRNAYLSLDFLQAALDLDERANALLVTGPDGDVASSPAASQWLREHLRPRLTDLGLRLSRVRRTYQPEGSDEEQVAYDYFSLSTEQMLFPAAASAALAEALRPVDGAVLLTYLANTIAAGDASEGIPYSTITALDEAAQAAILRDESDAPLGPLADDEIVLHRWAADDLNVQVGDEIRLDYFAPETQFGRTTEKSATFRLRGIAPLREPARPYRRQRPAEYDERPWPTNDPDLTPEVAGVTDQDSIDNWDPPFPFDRRRIRRDIDEPYWDHYRTTPKAYVSLAAGRTLWASRFGDATSFRIPAADGVTAAQLEETSLAALRDNDVSLGLDFQPLKAQALAAASGTTPFNMLFLGFSFFIIAAALLLVALLFRLGVERRASELGLLLAVGVPRSRAARLLVVEGAVVAALAAAVGVAVGVGYAGLMIAALTSPDWWLAAVSSPFLRLYVTGSSLAIGYASGVAVSCLTIAATVFGLRGAPARRLLAGQTTDALAALGRRRRWPWPVAVGLLVAAAGLAVLATRLGGEAQAGAFFGAGAAVLAAVLLTVWSLLSHAGSGEANFGLVGLALRSARRNPLRSTLTIGLMAAASFLIVGISAFQLQPTAAGAGGFEFVAQSDAPLFVDWSDPAARRDVLGEKAPALEGATVLSLRVRPGDDASCTNLYQSSQPRVLGVPADMRAHYDRPDAVSFAWAGAAADGPADAANPWRLLAAGPDADGALPAIVDKNTAMYSLHLYGGVGQTYTAEYDGQPVTFRIVGLLANSVLQGSLLIGEENFQRTFPEVSGYNFFLLEPAPGQAAAAAAALVDKLDDQGFALTPAREILDDLLAVQNTYLSTFQSLGALGLLLGALGLAAAQVRGVVERRGELALLRAAGFRRRRLAELVLLENLSLLLAGLASGVLAALVAVLPHYLAGGAAAPWFDLARMLAAVLAIGVGAGLLAVRAMLRAPLVAALRGE